MLIRDWGIGVICIKNHSGGSSGVSLYHIYTFYMEILYRNVLCACVCVTVVVVVNLR